MSTSINNAIARAIKDKAITSASIMCTCHAFRHAVELARCTQPFDIGIHFTLTSEWPSPKWGPLSFQASQSCLVDAGGSFKPYANPDLSININVLRAELLAQLDACLRLGMKLSHVDCHMYALFNTPEWFELYVEVAQNAGLAAFLPKKLISNKLIERLTGRGVVVNEHEVSASADLRPCDWKSFYHDAISSLPGGVSQMTVHLGFNDETSRQMMGVNTPWGASWRQRDFDVVTSGAFKKLLQQLKVELVSWSEVGQSRSSGLGD